ncbi:MAG: F0F1 ATP synthase subunit epsilon [Planctomycetota bacterium]
MQVRVITPESTVLESENAEHVLLPGENGEMGVLPGHISMITGLGVGSMRIDLPDEQVRIAVSGGFAEVLEDSVTVLADTAERAENINVQRATAAKRRAEERLAKRAADIDRARAHAALARANNRLRVTGRLEE